MPATIEAAGIETQTKQPIATNVDIVYAIAKSIHPDPRTFLSLAMVNRDFYTVFTSDRMWAQLDVYGKTTEIYKDFMERIRGNERLLLLCWSRGAQEEFVESIDNRYLQLGYYRSHRPAHLCLTHETGHPASEWLLRLCPYAFQNSLLNRCEEDLEDFQYVIETILKKRTEIYFLPAYVREDEDFCIELIKATRHSMSHLLGSRTPMEALEYAIVENPDAIAPQTELIPALEEGARRLRTGRQSILEFVTARPYFLDMFPEYWGDHEICMAALEPNGGISPHSFYFTMNFLRECENDQVISAALKLYPQAILSVPKRYRSRSAWRHAIEIAGGHSAALLDRKIARKPELRTDPDIFAACLESGMKVDCFDPEFRDKYLGDIEWMKKRVSVNTDVWYHAPKALKYNKEFFSHTIGASEYRAFSWSGFALHISDCPDSIFEDPETNKLVRKVVGWDSYIPKKDKFIDMRLEAWEGRDFTLDEDKESYYFIRAAIKQDVFRMRDCPKTVFELAKDPEMEAFIIENIYVIDWICGRFSKPRHFSHFPFSDLVLRYSKSNPDFKVVNRPEESTLDAIDCYRPDWSYVDRESILRIFMRYPKGFESIGARYVNKALILEAVKRDGNLFWELDPEYQNDSQVQRAIGSLSLAIKYDYEQGDTDTP